MPSLRRSGHHGRRRAHRPHRACAPGAGALLGPHQHPAVVPGLPRAQAPRGKGRAFAQFKMSLSPNNYHSTTRVRHAYPSRRSNRQLFLFADWGPCSPFRRLNVCASSKPRPAARASPRRLRSSTSHPRPLRTASRTEGPAARSTCMTGPCCMISDGTMTGRTGSRARASRRRTSRGRRASASTAWWSTPQRRAWGRLSDARR